MENISDILEEELAEAVEVKNRGSLHRYVRLMVDRFDDVNKKFTMLTALMALMFTVLGGMMTPLNLLAG